MARQVPNTFLEWEPGTGGGRVSHVLASSLIAVGLSGYGLVKHLYGLVKHLWPWTHVLSFS